MTISGSNLAGNPRLIAPFRFQIEPPPAAAKSDAANWKIKLTVAADVAVGVYPIRIQTDDGISNPFLLAVGQLPQVAEKEENSTFETAQAIPDPPLVVEGQVAGNDVDFFRFHGKKGQLIVVDAQCARIGSGIDPTIRLTTRGRQPRLCRLGRRLAGPADRRPADRHAPRGRRLRGRAVRFALSRSEPAGLPPGHRGGADGRGDLPAGRPRRRDGRPGTAGRNSWRGQDRRGDLEPAVRDRPGRAANLERDAGPVPSAAGAPVLDVESLAPLVVSTYPEVREAADPAAPPSRAVAPVVLNGRIDPPGDDDRFVLAVTPGQRLRIKVQAYEHGSALDGVLRVLGNGGSVLANADDTTIPLPPKNAAAPVARPPRPVARVHDPRRHQRDHARDARPRKPRRHRVSLPDRGRTALSRFPASGQRIRR